MTRLISIKRVRFFVVDDKLLKVIIIIIIFQFFALLFIIFCILLGAGIWAVVAKDDVSTVK